MNLLEVENLSISFGGIEAVSQISFSVQEGEVFSIIGPNGAGKTTIFNLLTGIYKCDIGTIRFKGKEIQNLSPQAIVKAGISRTFQNTRLFNNKRIIENVLMGMHIKTEYGFFDSLLRTKRFREQEYAKVDHAIEILEFVGLNHRASDYADNLAYGQQRKLEIARAIATGAKLLLLDEPAAGMNDSESENLLAFIKSLQGNGYTIILIEHDMNVVMNISDRICVIDHGKHIITDVPNVVQHNSSVIEAYLGVEEDDEDTGN